MAPLFSKVDLNKLWHDVQNEETLIYAKFGKDLFNISNAIGRKKVAQFFDSQCIQNDTVKLNAITKRRITVKRLINGILSRSCKCNGLTGRRRVEIMTQVTHGN